MKKTLNIAVVLIVFAVAPVLFAGGREEGEKGSSPAGAVSETNSAQAAAEAQAESGRVGYEELARIITAGDPDTYLVDVRTAAEYASGAIPTAINIPYDVIADNLPTEDRSARIIVYCRSGARSGIAYQTLKGLGFTHVLDFGGVTNWRGELESRK